MSGPAHRRRDIGLALLRIESGHLLEDAVDEEAAGNAGRAPLGSPRFRHRHRLRCRRRGEPAGQRLGFRLPLGCLFGGMHRRSAIAPALAIRERHRSGSDLITSAAIAYQLSAGSARSPLAPQM